MRLWVRQSAKCLLLATALLAGTAMAQVQVGDNTSISMSGIANFGYSGLFSHESSNQVDFGFSGDLTGYYYTPKFLNFRVSPYYNQSRMNSNFNSVLNGKGVTTAANLFAGSKIPLELGYDRVYTSEGQFNLPGSTTSYISTGKSDSFNLGWSLLPDNLPSLHVAYGLSNSEASLLSASTRYNSHSRLFSLGSGYSLWGFALGASYVNSNIDQTSPVLGDLSKDVQQDSRQSTTQFTVGRPLTRFASFSSQFSRSEFTADYTGLSSHQSYDTAAASLTVKPFSKLTLALNANYSTNLSAMLIQSLLPGSTTATQTSTTPAASLSDFSGDYFSYRATANYVLTNDLNADGSYDHRVQNGNRQATVGNDTVRGGLRYGRRLFGGQIGMYYGVTTTSSEGASQGTLGHTGSVTYSHDFMGWRNSAGFGVMRNESTALVDFSQSGYQYNFSTSRGFRLYLLNLTVHYQQSRINGINASETSGTGYSASVSRGKLSLNGSVGQQNGNSLQMLSGSQTPLTGQLLFPNLLVLYNGNSFSFGGSYAPSRRWRLQADYSRSLYHTTSDTLNSDNLLARYNIKSEYDFRQMRITCSYSHITQGLGASFNAPVKVNSIYIGVSRHFSLF